MRKITRSPLAHAIAVATTSLDTMQLDGSGGSVAFQGGVRWLVAWWGLRATARSCTLFSVQLSLTHE